MAGEHQSGPRVTVVEGDLLDQDVDAIVNAWNRNFIPHWLLLPQGVSKAIRKRAGAAPFRELRRHGLLALGGAVLTMAGKLPHKGIIHVAGLHAYWIASERSIRLSVHNAVRFAADAGFNSLALPLIGAGTGGKSQAKVQSWITDELAQSDWTGDARVVRFKR